MSKKKNLATFTHTCECGQVYTDNDPELYFCPLCIVKRKHIAAEIDKKFASKTSHQKSEWKMYEEERRNVGINVKGIKSIMVKL